MRTEATGAQGLERKDWSASVPLAYVALATYGFSRCALMASGTLALQSNFWPALEVSGAIPALLSEE